VLFAGDAFMPIPYMVDGNEEELLATIKKIGKMGLENIIQGHGDIILRGEIEDAVKENLSYLSAIRKAAKAALKKREPQEYLMEVDIESCGKSRVYLSGLAADLHKRNLIVLYQQYLAEAGGVIHPADLEPAEEV
jgi:glyoxylase-like metal-dependent hydrolase (beta-lactamase superfamily II)